MQPDFIVVGGGIAGLRAAIGLADAGRVLVVTKQELSESNTQYAQGGIAVALSDDDEIELHLQDTINAGDGLVNEEAARVLVEEGPGRIEELIAWGAEFDRSGSRLSFTREAAHSRSRILHAHGDSTGREIGRALYEHARRIPNISFTEFEFTADLCMREGAVAGVLLLAPDGTRQTVCARAVLLATGGAGQVYSDTTNPPVATGDGIAMAYRAGAEISDMEFFQFHPTALSVAGAPRFLLSEAMRGEGALLINEAGKRFMPGYHPNAELAPRDVVARALAQELAKSGPGSVVYLDMRHLDAQKLRERFPRIDSTCHQYGIDIARDPVPVRPAAHYLMGGTRTDLHGRTNIAGLFAAGEAACTGVHGANRLASNSLLEGLVFGARVVDAMCEEPERRAIPGPAEMRVESDSSVVMETTRLLKNAMWQHAGVVRDVAGLRQLLASIHEWKPRVDGLRTRPAIECRNLLTVGELIARSAVAREESRGAHHRTDFPAHNDETFRKHSIVRRDEIAFA